MLSLRPLSALITATILTGCAEPAPARALGLPVRGARLAAARCSTTGAR